MEPVPPALASSAGTVRPSMIAFGLAWAVVVAASFAWSRSHDTREIRLLAEAHARSHLQKDILIRRWVSGHGGVYVPRSDATPPNPYLAHLAHRDVSTADGRQLTLVNPAYLTRQLYEMAARDGGVRGHITSLRPLRPENAPDDWEADALRRFEQGEPAVSAVAMLDGRRHLRHMQPLRTEISCLQCHAHQGYRVGDVRGGISVAVPYAPYEALLAQETLRKAAVHAVIGLLGLLGIGLAGRRMAASERALREALAETARLSNRETLLASLNEGVVGIDRTGHVTFANPAARALLGVGEADLVGRPAHETLRRAPAGGRDGDATAAPPNGWPYDIEDCLLRADGRIVPVRIAGRAIVEDGEVVGEVVAFHDIGERQRAERALRETTDRLNEAQQMARIGSWELDLERNLLAWSDEVFRIFEIDPARFAASYEAFVAAIHPDDRAAVDAAYSDSLRTRQPYAITHRLLLPDGRIKYVHERCRTEFDAGGRPVRSVGTVQDVTDARHAEEELRAAKREVEALNASLEQRVDAAVTELEATHRSLLRANEQLTQAETMASLGRMVAMIAHELNTPIGNGRLAVTTLRERIAEFSAQLAKGVRRGELDGFLDTMAAGCELLDTGLQRASHLITSFKQIVVDQTTSQRRTFDLDTLVDEVATTLGPGVRHSGCTLAWHVEPGITLDSYPGPLAQVLINLIDNALRHAFVGRPPGHIEVRIAHRAAGGETEIRVIDDGIGVPPADHKRVFEPFFTTRMGQGSTGLGLSITYNAVTMVLGGRIELASESGRGACFIVTVPNVAPAVGTTADPA